MTVEIAMRVTGFLFWLIIITNIASNRFGYQTIGDLDAEADLQTISQNPRAFKIGFALILIEHVCIILLAIMLFMTFGGYNPLLALVWFVARGVEGEIQIINKRNYWRLLPIARQYAQASEDERPVLNALRLEILRSKHTNFVLAQILFAIGTLAYSIVFAVVSAVPAAIGWFGIVASLLYGLGNGIILGKPDFKIPVYLGGLLILLFETVLGGWLLFAYPELPPSYP